MSARVMWVIAFLRQHLLMILGALAILAIIIALWNFQAWPLAGLAVSHRHLLLIGILGGSLALPILLWGLPKWQAARPDLTPLDRFTVENEARKTLAQIVGGAAVLAGLYFTWANLQVTQETATKDREIAREGQITDRFTKAIAQLGDEKIAVRIGGIYALERIAKDSPERDHWPIMEVLTAYVRQSVPWPPKNGYPLQDDPLPQKEPPGMPQQRHPQLAADIQAILTVLGRRAKTYGEGETQRLNLARTDLRGVSLRGPQLQGAFLVQAQLQGAFLMEAQLQRAQLSEAQLQRANLEGAQLQGAFLWRTQLQGAFLREAQLQGANLETAQLQEANLERAQLQGAFLRGTYLKGAKNLTIEQLSTVKTLYQADIDSHLLEQVQQRYPQLLEARW